MDTSPTGEGIEYSPPIMLILLRRLRMDMLFLRFLREFLRAFLREFLR